MLPAVDEDHLSLGFSVVEKQKSCVDHICFETI